jgi:hypothetical protein
MRFLIIVIIIITTIISSITITIACYTTKVFLPFRKNKITKNYHLYTIYLYIHNIHTKLLGGALLMIFI